MTGRLLALWCVLLLAPAAAFAQSAGDEQYSDPFAGNSPSTKTTPTHSTPSHSTPTQSQSPSASASQGASSGSSQSGSQPASGSSTGTASSGSSTGTSPGASSSALPRTGYDAWPPALTGALMLLAGVVLRLGLARLPRRAR
jgi:cobalamin biosynthesis Mg chelatase CobN